MSLIDKIKDFKYKRSIATGITILALGTAIFHDAYYVDRARAKYREATQTIQTALNYSKENPYCSCDNKNISNLMEAEKAERKGDDYLNRTLVVKYLVSNNQNPEISIDIIIKRCLTSSLFNRQKL